MNISLDYDDTYTRDPDTWIRIIRTFQDAGHLVWCVTMRYESEGADVLASIGQHAPVVFTGRKAKRDFMYERGIRIDVWIDDRPDFILMSAAS